MKLLGLLLATSALTPVATGQVYVGFGHDTYGYGGTWQNTYPCQTMKVVTEGDNYYGDPPAQQHLRYSYQGVRIALGGTVADNPTCIAKSEVIVEFQHIDHSMLSTMVEDAVEGLDFEFAYYQALPLGDLEPRLTTNYTILLPYIDSSASVRQCCGGHLAIRRVIDEGKCELPELVRAQIALVARTVPGQPNVAIAQENVRGGWVIQDATESEEKFTYGPTSTGDDFYIQISNPANTPTDFHHFVRQNFPAAASEVVTEGQLLRLTLESRIVDARAGNFGVMGATGPLPNIVDVTVRARRDNPSCWSQGNYPYATPDAGSDYELWFRGAVQVPTAVSATDFQWVLRMLPGDEVVPLEIRTAAGGGDEGLEIAHLEIVAIQSLSIAPNPIFAPNPPTVGLGWSRAFRVVVQDDLVCR